MNKIEISRNGGRTPTELRDTRIERNYIVHPDGSCLISVGNTKVICTASIEEQVPSFLRGKGKGWITSEYGMIPRSTPSRMPRESAKGKMGGRTQEIQRLIGRSLRAVVDLRSVGERTIWIDCDVIQADGGTRTAAITGAAVALHDAFSRLVKVGKIDGFPMTELVAAVSVGIVRNFPLLDLDYVEDSSAEVDMNVVMTESGKFVEIQGTAEGLPFTHSDLNSLVDVAKNGIKELVAIQRRALEIGG